MGQKWIKNVLFQRYLWTSWVHKWNEPISSPFGAILAPLKAETSIVVEVS